MTISETIGTAKGGVEALKAGVDLIMVSHLEQPQYETLKEVEAAVESGEVTEETLNEAYNRVMNLKNNYLSWDDIPLEGELTISSEFGSEQHENEAREIYKQGITIVKNEQSLIPLSLKDAQKVLVVYPENSYALLVEDERYATFSLGATVKDLHSNTTIKELSNPPTAEQIEEVGQLANSFDAIIVGTLSVSPGDQQVKLVEEIVKYNEKVIVVATRSPYDISYLPDAVSAYVNTYEFTYPALSIAVKAIFGKEQVTGKLPVTLP